MTRVFILITTGLFIIVYILYFAIHLQRGPDGKPVPIVESWELPEILQEVSGIAYIGNGRMACVQDEDGIIFIYDLKKRQIEREIEFSGEGDYESITLAGNTAYVLRSDGKIYEVYDYLSTRPVIKTFYEHQESGNNFEGLEYDEKNNRLLLSIKEERGKEYRPVYSIDINTGKLAEEPVYKIALGDPVFSVIGKRNTQKNLRPSEITIHPQTGKIYILEGINPKVLILNEDGTPGKLHLLSRKQFRQAEGLTFGENGELYISNEGNGRPPNILQISLN